MKQEQILTFNNDGIVRLIDTGANWTGTQEDDR